MTDRKIRGQHAHLIMNEDGAEIVEPEKPWNEVHHQPLNGEISVKKMRRFQRAKRNGNSVNNAIKRRNVLVAVGMKAMAKREARAKK